MRTPLRAWRKSFCTTSLCACGQYQLERQLPPVDDVADEIDRIGIVVAQEVEQPIGLAAFGSEMHVGDEQRAKRPCASRGHDIAILLRITKRERLTALCCATMTPATLRVT